MVRSPLVCLAGCLAAFVGSGCDSPAKPDPCLVLDTDTCDIAQLGCQQQTFCLVLEVRGGQLDEPPAVIFISEDEYVEHLISQSGGSTPATEHWDAVLALLGVLDPSDDLSMAELKARLRHIVAYYSRVEEAIVFVDRGIEVDPAEQRLTLAHEYVHALRDFETDLEAFWQARVHTKNDDFSARTLVEGEAVFYTELLKTKLFYGMAPGDVRWEDLYGPMLERNLADVAEDASPFVLAGVALPYPLGGARVTELYLEGGNDAVNGLFEAPLPSSIDWMAPLGDVTTGAAPQTPMGPSGLQPTYDEVLGAAMVYAFLVGADLAIEEAWELARKTRSDAIATFWDEPGNRHAAAWAVVFESEVSAAEAEQVLRNANLGTTVGVSREGEQLLLRVASSEELLGEWGF